MSISIFSVYILRLEQFIQVVRATHTTIVKSLYHLFQQTPLKKPKDKLIISLINKELLQINKSNKSVEKNEKSHEEASHII